MIEISIAQFDLYLDDVAAALTTLTAQQWKVKSPGDDRGRPVGTIIREENRLARDEARASLHLEIDRNGRVVIGAGYNSPTLGYLYSYVPRDSDFHITVAYDRGPIWAAQSAIKRLLPDYEPVLLHVREKYAQAVRRQAERHTIGLALAQVLGTRAPDLADDPNHQKPYHFSKKIHGGRVAVELQYGSVEITLNLDLERHDTVTVLRDLLASLPMPTTTNS